MEVMKGNLISKVNFTYIAQTNKEKVRIENNEARGKEINV